ncbi:MAG: multiubiquitin domain-containing protein [Crocinitomicaceae bacterium]|nr:multiubiquitin domain-containing protein [Crocinitomicaceae bacterium]
MNNEKDKHDNSNEYIDIEEYSKLGKQPPKGAKYLIKIDKALYKVEEECMTGRQILELAEKKPVERFQLNFKIHKGAVKKIEYDETVCFSEPGIERFMTIPLDQTEG